MKISQENIYRVLEGVSDKGATVREILAAMGQKKKRKTQLKKVLKLLSRNRVCYKRNNRYYLHDQPAPVSGRGSKRNHIHPNIRNGTTGKNENLGMIIGFGRNRVIHSFQDLVQYPISKGNLRDLLQGDVVRFAVISGKGAADSAGLVGLVERRVRHLKGILQTNRKGQVVFLAKSGGFKHKFNVTNSDRFKRISNTPAWLDLSGQVMNRSLPEGSARLIKDENDDLNRSLDEILTLNKIPSRFPPKVQKASLSHPKSVRFDPKAGRKDLRSFPFVTIDGEDARDFDDAVYAKQEGDHYRIWVSIADVDAYVPEGSLLDREAFCRGTSTYLPGKVYPMLPESISNGICSLKKGVNRKTLTCEILIDNQGKNHYCRIYTSMSRIACRLTYTAVDRFYETGFIKQAKSNSDLPDLLGVFRKTATLLRNKRTRAGYIDFQLPEPHFIFNNDNRIVAIEKEYQSEAMRVIEHLMLLANENVALYCQRNKIPIVWRNHAQPLREKREELSKLFWNRQIKISSLRTGRDYNKALEAIKNSKEKDFLEVAMLRSMSLAVYETENRGHFGIAFSHYCHFTSPIRRYPDLLVHRAIKKHLKGIKPDRIPDYMATTSSDRERLATAAERAAVKVYGLAFMSDRIGELFSARVSGLIHKGMFVEIESPYVEGFVPLFTIRDDNYEFDADLVCLYGRKSKNRISIGTRLQVLLTSLDWKNRTPEFDWICWQE